MTPKSAWKHVEHVIRNRLLSGLLVLIPVGITAFVVGLLYRLLGVMLAPLHAAFPETFPPWKIGLLSVLFMISAIYLIGAAAQFVIGRRLIELADAILRRIPIVKTIYGALKQAIDTIATSSGETDPKQAVMIEFPRAGMWVVAFATGRVRLGVDGPEYVKVFVPTTPNPTSGFFELALPERVYYDRISMEEALKVVMSGGVLPSDFLDIPTPGQLNTSNEGNVS